MSGILGWVSQRHEVRDHGGVDRMLGRMQGRGSERSIEQSGAAVLAVCRFPWEFAAGFAGDCGVRSEGDLAVAADASLYYRDDLIRRLAGAGARAADDSSASSLILAAYRAWGATCAEHLEGDFAFVLWDRRTRTLTCARDFSGRRPLYFVDRGAHLLAASTVGALLAAPEASEVLDWASVAAAAAGLFAAGTETAYRSIATLPGGHTLVWRDGRARILPHWRPPQVEERDEVERPAFGEASERLRLLLKDAVSQRLAKGSVTSVWMSGGWDSTAVFGAGNAGIRDGDATGTIRPVSISYPTGDPGREDEYIAQVATHWDTPVHWLDIGEIPFFQHPRQRAAARDEPFAHAYETLNRTLARGSRAIGARIALDGVGGDQLFQLSMVYLADLFRRGRWGRLRREWSAKGMRSYRGLAQWAVLPLVPGVLRRVLGAVWGEEAVRSYLARPIPPWMNRGFLERHGVLERERRYTPSRGRRTHAAYETYWYLAHPFATRILACVSSMALEEGVELRSPLYDPRIIEFAASRPWTERALGRETKRLLRAAVAGWVPDAVLAPRRRRTGVTSGYLARSLRERYAPFISTVLRSSALADFGILDSERLRQAWVQYRRTGDENLGVSLFFTLQTELWIRRRLKPAPG